MSELICAYLMSSTGQHKFARLIRNGLPVVLLAACFPIAARPQKAEQPASLHGAVRDSQGKLVSGAKVSLQAKDSKQTLASHTDSQGIYSFGGLHPGVYVLQAESTEHERATLPSLFLGPAEAKNADLVLMPQSASSQSAASPSPQFFDQPQFTVSGVTDTTSLGGHGSDTVVRSRETIAKETASLGKRSVSLSSANSTAVEKSLREQIERDTRNFDANHRLGKMLVEDGRARESIPYLERAVALNSGDYDSAYDLARANAEAGNYERARNQAQALLTRNDKAELHHLLGNVEEKLGNSLGAVREYERAGQLDPSENYFFDWGSELLLHHAPEPALEVFGKGNREFPHSVRMLIGLGAAWFARGAYDQAVERICEASDLNPGDPDPYLFLGKIQTAESRAPSDEIVERLHRFVTLQPESAEANYYYAVALWKKQKSLQGAGTAEEESLLDKAIRLNPKFSAAYLQLGILHFEQENYPRAISEYQQAIQAAPQMEEAHYRLAQAYRQIGETGKQKAELQLYDQMAKESAQKAERERREIRQFVYTLRDQQPAQNP